MNNRLWLSLVLAVGLMQAGLATAADVDAPSVVVKTSDLDLASARGAQALANRLRHAASDVCGGEPSLGDLVATQAYDACTSEALSDAVRQVSQPLVAERLHMPTSTAAAPARGPG